jgi:ribosomal-protein-alanine N-acetyltransferase
MHLNEVCLPENYSRYFFMDLYMRFPETFIVAEENGAIIGYIMCRIENGIAGFGLNPFNTTKKGHVISIAVKPESRQKGVASALIKEAIRAMATHKKAKECHLEVRVGNTPAISLYKKIGFETKKTARGYYSDGEDAYIMSVKLA